MKKGEILTLTIKDVSLCKVTQMVQGSLFGSYTSNYVARFMEYPNGIAVVDDIASSKHPDWDKKTDNRANILTSELKGKQVTVRVTEVFAGKDTFESEIVQEDDSTICPQQK